MRSTTFACVCAAVMACGAAAGAAQQQPLEPVTVALSDPSRPGTVRANVMMGSITVTGENRKDVLITPRARAGRPDAPAWPTTRGRNREPEDVPPGMRRLSQPGDLRVTEENNQISVGVGSFMRPMDLDIRVPSRTALRLTSMNGSIVVDGVEGEIEVNSHNGGVTLTNVAGAVVAVSMNGTVKATLSRVAADKAMSFVSMNGTVDVTLPASVRANFKMRSERGDVYTDFDLQLRTAESRSERSRSANGRFRYEVNDAIYGSANGGGPEIELRTFNGRVMLRKGP